MRKIKIKEKNHNLRIKYKEGEWKKCHISCYSIVRSSHTGDIRIND